MLPFTEAAVPFMEAVVPFINGAALNMEAVLPVAHALPFIETAVPLAEAVALGVQLPLWRQLFPLWLHASCLWRQLFHLPSQF